MQIEKKEIKKVIELPRSVAKIGDELKIIDGKHKGFIGVLQAIRDKKDGVAYTIKSKLESVFTF